MCNCEDNVGGRIGRKLGTAAQRKAVQWAGTIPGMKKIKNWVGKGDYTINSNSLITGADGIDDLSIQTHGNVFNTFTFREYLGDVFSGPGPALATGDQNSIFSVQSFAINPGLVQLHPWLAPIAQQYEQWEPLGYIFEFQSKLTDFSTTQNLGSMMMASDYDVLDPPYTSKQEMLNAQYSSESKPTENMIHGLECDPALRPQSMFYVRSGDVAGDLREYDLCNFQIGTVGIPLKAAAGVVPQRLNLGSLYVHYTVRLYKAQLSNGLNQKGQLQALYGLGTIGQRMDAYNNSTQPWGPTAPIKAFDSIGLRFTVDTTGSTIGRINFPANITSGTWLIMFEVLGSAAPATGVQWICYENSLVNCVNATQAYLVDGAFNGYNYVKGASVNNANSQLGFAVSANWVGVNFITITGPNASCVGGPANSWIPASWGAGNPTQVSAHIYVCNVNNFSVV